MNKKLLSAIIAVICIISSVAVLFGVMNTGAEDAAVCDTTIPTLIFDFSDPLTYDIKSFAHFTTETGDGYLTYIATEDDPFGDIGTAGVPASKMLYASIGYSAEVKKSGRQGEMFFTADNGMEYSEQSKVQWKWDNTDGSWNTQIVYVKCLDGVDATVNTVRFDPLASNNPKIEAGEKLNITHIAFFDNEDDAKSFDIQKYREYILEEKRRAEEAERDDKPILPGDWKVPEPAEREVAQADNFPGSFNITKNSDGTATISYLLNGETKSYTVPDTYTYTNGGYAGVDDLGRALPTSYTVIDPDYTSINGKGYVKTVDAESRPVGIIGDNGQHYVGIFYFLWLGEHGDHGINNMQDIIDKYGDKAGDPSVAKEWGDTYYWHHFAEPLYGYYYSNDTWVMRKHVELLINANIDFVYFDTTNTAAYVNNALRLMKILHEYNVMGYNAPKVVFYTNSDAQQRVEQIYSGIYQKNYYPDTWFMIDGKPVIIAPNGVNVNDYFTVKVTQWPYDNDKKGAWPWIDWNWPQHIFKDKDGKPDAVNVSVAQHSGNGEFSTSALYGYTGNRGRSFDGTNDKLTKDSYKLGLNMQNEFNFAIQSGVPYVLVTGWNEWVATRQEQVNPNYPIRFVDTVSFEYSRDIEMSRGGYFDNYYMQLASNVSALKGTAPALLRDDRHAIDVFGSFDQWNDVKAEYRDGKGDTAERDGHGFGGSVYKNDTGRNDIISAKTASDTSYLYFYIKCRDTIQRADGGSFLRIYLNTDGKTTGWYGYDYIVNYALENDLSSTVAKYSGNNGEYGFTPCGNADCRIYGNEMMVGIPLEMLGIAEYDRIYVEFKIADGKTEYDEMEDFYIDGDVAPLGRMNFIYQTYIPGVTEGEGNAIVKLADKAAQIKAESEKPEETTAGENNTSAGSEDTASEETSNEDKDSGCGSLACGAALILCAICGMAFYKINKTNMSAD